MTDEGVTGKGATIIVATKGTSGAIIADTKVIVVEAALKGKAN